MSQETPERLLLAATIRVDASPAPVFVANQGFASVQSAVDAGGSSTGIILRPAELPATPGNMIAQASQAIGAAVGAIPSFGTTIVGPGGLAGTVWGAAVIAAAQPGDVVVFVPLDPLVEGLELAVLVTQITPAE